jgi:hypothetical protein
MTSLIQRYIEYRRVGFGRLAAFRYAWFIASVTPRRITIR